MESEHGGMPLKKVHNFARVSRTPTFHVAVLHHIIYIISSVSLLILSSLSSNNKVLFILQAHSRVQTEIDLSL